MPVRSRPAIVLGSTLVAAAAASCAPVTPPPAATASVETPLSWTPPDVAPEAGHIGERSVAEIRRADLGPAAGWTPTAVEEAAREVGVDPGVHRESYRSPYGPEPMALRITPPRIGRVRLPGGIDWLLCGGAVTGTVPIRWETLTAGERNEGTLSLAEGTFDVGSCTPSATHRSATPVRAVAWGAARARLSSDPSASGAPLPERLVLLLPRARVLETTGDATVDPGAITHVVNPLEQAARA